MKKLTAITAKRTPFPTIRFFLTIIIVFAFVSCQKEMNSPVGSSVIQANDPLAMGDLQITDTRVILLQGNENLKATTLHWNAIPNAVYTVEAAAYGVNFSDRVELGTTDLLKMDISVKELNRLALLMIPAGSSGMIEFRVRGNMGKSTCMYTTPIALQVTTYQPYTEYDLSNLMHIPGSFNNWDVKNAPRIVDTHNDGEFEGVINFNNNYTQFLIVKDITWNSLNTYYNIQNNKIGFKGNVFNIYEGIGAYQIKVNTNTNNWTCTKINTLSLHGTAVKSNACKDPEMTYDAQMVTWTLTTSLAAGNFRISVNNNNEISYGKTMVNGYLVPDTKGADFTITNAGSYKIVLNLKIAGNYTCTVAKAVIN